MTARSISGVTLDQTSIDGASEMSYDALGCNVAVAVSDASGATNRVDSLEYDQSGNVVRRVTDFRDGRVAEATAEYDMLNREVRRTDALGNETATGYDPLGRTVSTSGDAYPILSGFDSAGRKTHGFYPYTGTTVKANTAYLDLPATTISLSPAYSLFVNNPTGIHGVTTADSASRATPNSPSVTNSRRTRAVTTNGFLAFPGRLSNAVSSTSPALIPYST